MVDTKVLEPYLKHALAEINLHAFPNHYRGKVRDNYDLADGRRIIIASDRLSAFDINLTTIPLKGQVLTQIARYWFEATKDICPNHVLTYPDPNVVVCQRLTIFPVEIVVRDYLAGSTGTSIWTMYHAGKREMHGLNFPDGMIKNQKLPETIITPTTKAFDAGHDEPLSPREIFERKLLTEEQWGIATRYAFALFERGKALARERGLILVDTKYEFGFDAEGRIVLADEIHTPDSSRYWFLESYKERFEDGDPPESFDKDFIRNWVVARCDPYTGPVPPIPDNVRLQAAVLYIRAFEMITGHTLILPDPSVPTLTRIDRALKSYQ
ncbi:MAG: phosphoribosylaminoimidazolesuccinocarboxamide synthase [Pseudomonadota bacterium]|nr:phosphoribosylaminoimidazolesuccinocarboxamide synthase [Pseudomonadota bacterium]